MKIINGIDLDNLIYFQTYYLFYNSQFYCIDVSSDGKRFACYVSTSEDDPKTKGYNSRTRKGAISGALRKYLNQ